MKENKTPVIVIVGPTASGKTALSIELAKKLDAEIISADSMQVYKGMDIATAKPTKQEMQGVIHHLIDFVDVSHKFSVAEYIAYARRAADDILSRGKKIIIVGGTGMYISSFIDNIQFDKEDNFKLRSELIREHEKNGNQYMYEKLKTLDPDYAQKLHVNDIGRIIRGIEINLQFNHNMSRHMENSRSAESPYNPLFIGINYKDRQKLYDRIDLRVDKMLEDGLLKEAMEFFDKLDNDKTAVQAIGYKELFPYINGELSFEKAVENLKKATRNYAKRQLTWFRKNQRIFWFNKDELSENELVENAFSLCKSFNL